MSETADAVRGRGPAAVAEWVRSGRWQDAPAPRPEEAVQDVRPQLRPVPPIVSVESVVSAESVMSAESVDPAEYLPSVAPATVVSAPESWADATRLSAAVPPTPVAVPGPTYAPASSEPEPAPAPSLDVVPVEPVEPPPLHRDPRLVARGGEVLAGISALCPSLVSATLLTDDGFTVAQVPRLEEADDRLSSMASSVQALGDAVARELVIGASEYVVLAAESGLMVQRRIRGLPIVVAAHFGDEDDLAGALRVTATAAEWLAEEWAVQKDGPRRREPRHRA